MPSISMKKDYKASEGDSDGLIIQQQQQHDKFPDSFKSLKNLWESKSTYTINYCEGDNGQNRSQAEKSPKKLAKMTARQHQAKSNRSTFLQRGHSLDNGHQDSAHESLNCHDKNSNNNRSTNFVKIDPNATKLNSDCQNNDQLISEQLAPGLKATNMKRHNGTSSTYEPLYPFALGQSCNGHVSATKSGNVRKEYSRNMTNTDFYNGSYKSSSLTSASNSLSSKEVLKQFAHYLTPEEQKEILKYDSVWYLGKLLGKVSDLRCKRPLVSSNTALAPKYLRNGNNNSTSYFAERDYKTSDQNGSGGQRQNFYYYDNGGGTKGKPTVDASGPNYTDKDGLYKIGSGDHIAYRYEITDLLGQGSFSQVVKAYDHRDSKYVALKIIRNKKRFHQQALTEIKLLKNLQNSIYSGCSDLTVEMMDHFYFRQHLCIVFELLGPSLYDTLKKSNFRGFPLDLVKDITGSLLKCLSTLRKHRIIHCDFKPENILVKPKTKFDIKLIDFGSSCYENEQLYTYIQSRFYRAPEVILGASQYTPAIDIWSLGCVAAELYTGYPLFPGEDEKDQLACFIEILGLPPKDMSHNCERWKEFFDSKGNLRSTYKGITRIPNSKNLSGALKCSDYLFIDFLYKCFRWNPSERLTPKEALYHPWISSISLKNINDKSLLCGMENGTKSTRGYTFENNSSNKRGSYLTNGSNSTSDTSLTGDAASSFSSNDSTRFTNKSLLTSNNQNGDGATKYKSKTIKLSAYPSTGIATTNRYQDMLNNTALVGSLSCKLQHLELNGTKYHGPYGIDKKYYANPYAYQALDK